MPAALTLDKAYDRLFELMPDWMDGITDPSWLVRWQQASGDSRATAYRMKGFALAIDAAMFELFTSEHPELKGAEMIEAFNDHWGLPSRWKTTQGRFNGEGKRIPGLIAA